MIAKPVMHVTHAIASAHWGTSELPMDVLELKGYSSPQVRHLLNNICRFEGCRFLEVGAYCGATAVAASYNNKGRFVTVDHFQQYDSREVCEKVLVRYRRRAPVELIVEDALTLEPSRVGPIDVFFYDGAHDAESTQRIIEHFAPMLADTCVLIVDDWNWRMVRNGTRAVRPERPWYLLAHWEMFTKRVQDKHLKPDNDSWWNGLFVGVYGSEPPGL